MKFSIGQVSKLFDISKDTLRYYDKIGILKPDTNENNGYRYYSLHHIEKLGLILGTKYLGISLTDIKATIESENIKAYKDLVIKQEVIIKEKISEFMKLEENLKESKEILDEIINFENEYDFSKLKTNKEKYNLYGIDINNILKLDFYKEYLITLEKELENLKEESFYYIYTISNTICIEEEENIVYIKESQKNKEIINRYLKVEGIEIIEKAINSDIISTNFYGTIEEIKNYIILLNDYFGCNKDNEAYVMYEFYLPKKDKNEMYFVNINLKI